MAVKNKFECTEVCCIKQILTQEQHSSPDLHHLVTGSVAVSTLGQDGSCTEPALNC